MDRKCPIFLKEQELIDITIAIGAHNSNIHPLENGIPQGSAISVALFLKPFNKLANILTRY